MLPRNLPPAPSPLDCCDPHILAPPIFITLIHHFLGHIVGDGKLAVPEHRAAAMKEFKLPRMKELRSFLGVMLYYRRFILHFADYSSCLSPSTSKKASSVVQWTEEMLQTFHSLKLTLCQMCELTVPVQNDVFSLHTASGAGLGATLNVIRDGVEVPVASMGSSCRDLRGDIRPLN